MNRIIASLLFIFAVTFTACANDSTKNNQAAPNGGLKLPAGFTATVVADKLGNARHIVVNSNGDVYVKLERLKDGKGILRLRDTNADGVADEIVAFGNFAGTGIAINKGYLYASSDEAVYRFKLNSNNEVENPDQPELIVTGLVNKRQHSSKSLAFDNNGNMYVTIGAPSNACQEKDRTAGSPGQTPCPILETAGGVWQFNPNKLNQTYADGVRYITGLRNVVGLDWNSSVNELYVTQHGRDQLNQLHPIQYSVEQSAELPAEEFFMAKKAMDFGWPFCYYDPVQKMKVHAYLGGVLQNQLEFGVLLDDRNDVAADLLRPHRQLDELGVLESVAHDRRVVAGHGGHGHQLRLGPGFEAEAVLLTELHHLLHDLPLLVDLDRVDAHVLAGVLVLRDGLLERGVDFAETVLQDAGEAEQNRRAQAAELEAIDQLLQVDRAGGILGGMHQHVPRVAHGEIALAPTGHVVVFGGFGHAPLGRGAAIGGPQLVVGRRAHVPVEDKRKIPACDDRFASRARV